MAINTKNSLGIAADPEPLPFFGHDVWNAYEVSWLQPNGVPAVAIAQFVFPCTSPNLIESKSLKLYLNSFNSTTLPDHEAIVAAMQRDLSEAAGAPVQVLLTKLSDKAVVLEAPGGICIDHLDVKCTQYTVDPNLLLLASGLPPTPATATSPKKSAAEDPEAQLVTETLHSNLLKSNCLVTKQPDWGTLVVTYTGVPIDHKALLQYVVSFRNHDEFHEQCVERVFTDIQRKCKPKSLTVSARLSLIHI